MIILDRENRPQYSTGFVTQHDIDSIQSVWNAELLQDQLESVLLREIEL